MIKINLIPKNIKIGKQIYISKKTDMYEHLVSQVLDIVNENEIIISGPIKKGNLIFIHRDESIDLYFTVENMGRYYFTGKVISRTHSPIYSLRVKIISEVKKIQDREYFRLTTVLPTYKVHTIPEDGIEDYYYEKCELRDLSGGGMKIYCNFEHNLNDEIYCIIEMENTFIESKAIVKRVRDIDTFDYNYSIGVSFLDIDNLYREKIIKYIFDRQRILRNKGLI